MRGWGSVWVPDGTGTGKTLMGGRNEMRPSRGGRKDLSEERNGGD